jgi:tetratricopeptide (TPR) repeat protein
MKKYLSAFILVFYCVHGSAQDIATLKQQAQHLKEDTAAVRILTDLSNAFDQKNEIDSCKKYALQALQLINSLIAKAGPAADKDYLHDCELLRAAALSSTADALTNENLSAAIDTFHEAILLRKSLNTKLGLGDDYFDLAYVYYILNDNTTADSLFGLSIDTYKAVDDKSGLGRAYNWRAINLRQMGNNGDALENNLQALAIGKQIKDSSILTDAFLAMGFIYMKAKLWNDALANQKAALNIFIAAQDSLGIATAYNDMGVVDMMAGRYDLSLQNHEAALAIRLRYSNNNGNISSSYSYISSIYDL